MRTACTSPHASAILVLVLFGLPILGYYRRESLLHDGLNEVYLQNFFRMSVVGFFTFLQPKQNAYTKVALNKTAEFRPHVKHVSSTGWLWGIYTPNLCYIMTSISSPAQNILRIFRSDDLFTGWKIQIVYSIRFVHGTLSRRLPVTFGLAPDLREPSPTSGGSPRLRTFGGTFGLFGPSASSGDLRVPPPTFGLEGDLRSSAPFNTFGRRLAVWGNLWYMRW